MSDDGGIPKITAPIAYDVGRLIWDRQGGLPMAEAVLARIGSSPEKTKALFAGLLGAAAAAEADEQKAAVFALIADRLWRA